MTADGVTIPSMPLYAWEITSEMKDEFLDLIYCGHKANTAADLIGTTGTQMRKFKRQGGVHYDEGFARQWATAEASDEHIANRQEALRALVDERSEKSDSVLIKRAMAELPEWEPLRHQNLHHDHEYRIKLEALSYFLPEEVEAAVARAEAAKLGGQQPLRLLEAAKDDDL